MDGRFGNDIGNCLPRQQWRRNHRDVLEKILPMVRKEPPICRFSPGRRSCSEAGSDDYGETDRNVERVRVRTCHARLQKYIEAIIASTTSQAATVARASATLFRKIARSFSQAARPELDRRSRASDVSPTAKRPNIRIQLRSSEPSQEFVERGTLMSTAPPPEPTQADSRMLPNAPILASSMALVRVVQWTSPAEGVFHGCAATRWSVRRSSRRSFYEPPGFAASLTSCAAFWACSLTSWAPSLTVSAACSAPCLIASAASSAPSLTPLPSS